MQNECTHIDVIGTVPRSALIQAIEGGIAAARTLTQADKIALRLVGIVAERVDVRLFGYCPLGQAGLGAYAEPQDPRLADGALVDFYSAFDRVMDCILNGGARTEVGTVLVSE